MKSQEIIILLDQYKDSLYSIWEPKIAVSCLLKTIQAI